MKKYIDYLFWKRTWFRMLILFPAWVFPIGILLHRHGVDMSPNSTGRMILCILYVCVMAAATVDNDDVDSPENPFKKAS